MEKFKLVPFHEQLQPPALLSDFSSNSPLNALRQELDALNQVAPVLSSDNEIWQRYKILFYKFFHTLLPGSSLPASSLTAGVPADTLENVIVETLPKSYQQKARILLLILKTAAPTSQLTWQPDGKIMFRNTVIPDSNLAELVHFALKRRRRGVPYSLPAAWLEFRSVLENLPLGMRNLLKLEFTSPPSASQPFSESAGGSAEGAPSSNTATPSPKRGGLRPRGKAAGANTSRKRRQLLVSAAARTESRDRQLSEKRSLSAAPGPPAIIPHGEKESGDDDEQGEIEWHTS